MLFNDFKSKSSDNIYIYKSYRVVDTRHHLPVTHIPQLQIADTENTVKKYKRNI